MTTNNLFGVIDEDELSLRGPRCLDEGPFMSIYDAMQAATEMIEDGAEKISIVHARFSKRNELYVEDSAKGSIAIDAYDFEVEE